MKPPVKEKAVYLSPASSDDSVLSMLKEKPGPVDIVLVTPETAVVRCRGMLSIAGGQVSPEDLGKVLDAALSIPQAVGRDRVIAAKPVFAVDGVAAAFPPVGLPAKRLECQVAYCEVPEGTISRWVALAGASQRQIASWSVEVTP